MKKPLTKYIKKVAVFMGKSKYRYDFEEYFQRQLGMDIMSDQASYEYVKSIVEPTCNTQVVFSDSPAGTGKSMMSMAAAYYRLRTNTSNKIIYVRNTLAVRENGFLPGTAEEKEHNFMMPAKESLDDIGVRLGQQGSLFYSMLDTDQIEVTSTSYLRGRDFDGDVTLILDEAQNLDTTEIQTVLTRLHDDAKVVVIGSSKQVDNHKLKKFGRERLTPFQIFVEHFKNQTAIPTKFVNLTKNYRGALANYADEIGQTIESVRNSYSKEEVKKEEVEETFLTIDAELVRNAYGQ